MANLMFKAFGMVFLAEMGDKTQLATLGLASATGGGRRAIMSVFVGSAIALVLTSAVAAVFGSWISAHVPPRAVKAASGAMFLLFGALYLREAILGGGGPSA